MLRRTILNQVKNDLFKKQNTKYFCSIATKNPLQTIGATKKYAKTTELG